MRIAGVLLLAGAFGLYRFEVPIIAVATAAVAGGISFVVGWLKARSQSNATTGLFGNTR